VAWRYYGDLVALAADVDYLVVVTPGGPATRHLVDRKVIEALGPKGTLINIARGTVVDEPALIAALRSGAIAGAGLDVYAREPDVDAELAAMDNVVLYPHHASGTVETRDAMARMVIDNLEAFFAGRPLLSPVNLRRQNS
jgi:lactate dehydrogenase-like 2-hydroxyacid dehydrogenase